MMRLALFLLAVLGGALGDSLHIRVVLDASSPAEYNRWVWQHRTECPGFQHVYITCDSWMRRGKFELPAVSFWTDSGPILVHRILPDSQLAPPPVVAMGPILDISANTDQLTVRSGRDSFAMYNRYGTRLFTDPSRPQGLMSGRWMTHIAYPFKSLLVDDRGKVLGTVSPSGIPRVLHADDSALVVQDIDGTVVLFDRDGRALWRSRKLGSPTEFAVGRRTHAIAASTDDSLLVFSPPRRKITALPHDGEWKHFGSPSMTWSDDGKLLAVYQRSQTAWDSGRVFVVDAKGKLVRPAHKMQLYNVRSLMWMGDTLVLPALNVDFSHTDPRISYEKTADSCVVSFLPPKGGLERLTIRDKFRIYGRWAMSGRHLAYTYDRHYMIAELRSGRNTDGRSGSPR